MSNPSLPAVVEIILDFESTGTTIEDTLIEVAVIGINTDFEEVFVIDSMIADGDLGANIEKIESIPILKAMHGGSGLLDDLKRVAAGELQAISIEELDALIYENVTSLNGGIDTVVLGGSGISHYDALVIAARMPLTNSILKFYSDDVGHVRRSYERAIGKDLVPVNDSKTHRALADARDHLFETVSFDRYFKKANAALEYLGLLD